MSSPRTLSDTSSFAVSIIIGMSDLFLNLLQTSIPLSFGSIRSNIIKSTLSFNAFSKPSLPLFAISTSYPSYFNSNSKNLAIFFSSSIIRIFLFSIFPPKAINYYLLYHVSILYKKILSISAQNFNYSIIISSSSFSVSSLSSFSSSNIFSVDFFTVFVALSRPFFILSLVLLVDLILNLYPSIKAITNPGITNQGATNRDITATNNGMFIKVVFLFFNTILTLRKLFTVLFACLPKSSFFLVLLVDPSFLFLSRAIIDFTISPSFFSKASFASSYVTFTLLLNSSIISKVTFISLPPLI